MRKVLIVAYYYPPLGGIGSLRPLHFSKYLIDYGWQPIVLTVADDKLYIHDESLIKQIPPQVPVVRAPRYPISVLVKKILRGPLRSKELAFNFLDSQFDWVANAVHAAHLVFKKDRYDAVLATAPPYSTLRVAAHLKKKVGVPIVADLRDPFATNKMINWPTPLHKRFYDLYERKLLSKFDRLIVVNDSMRDEFCSRIPCRKLEPLVVPNGYDPADFEREHIIPPKNKFVISYVGSIYGKFSARMVFSTLKRLLERYPDISEELQVIFMGRIQKTTVLQEIHRYGLDQIVQFIEPQPHVEAVRQMKRSHVLILFTGMMLPDYIPAKTFEYAAAGRPILNWGRPGFLHSFINESGLGISFDGTNHDQGANIIFNLYRQWKQNKPLPVPPHAVVERYSRRNLTGKIAEVLDSLTK